MPSLLKFDGLSALKIAQKRNPDIPFILISGTIGEELASSCNERKSRLFFDEGELKTIDSGS